ncbi:hypothetical protein C7293_26220 [filamentous cyanobacterium CCT1]|nr:hypothetical protein C7293_26220 [filamentous cyanobacterium CCT1]PSN77563.1 hypothetical protein C8B47_21425 [filamentous cyanobacterium CCP4]
MAHSAQAASFQTGVPLSISGNFTIKITEELDGDFPSVEVDNTFFGSFFIKNITLTGVGFEDFSGVRLSFDLPLGVTFSEQDDDGFPEFPLIGFDDGELFGLNFLAFANNQSLFLSGDQFESFFNLDPTSPFIRGTVTYGDVAANPVPTPALLPGLVGLGLAACHKRYGHSENA